MKPRRSSGGLLALRPGGADVPSYGFYAIHHPWAHPDVKLTREDFGDALQSA